MRIEKKSEYSGCMVYSCDMAVDGKDDLERIGTDQKNWRHFYRDMDGNVYIQFYPYGEYHGGGQPYMIGIKGNDSDTWLRKHPNFENEIRRDLDMNR